MESATTVPVTDTHADGAERHFALELLGLIARVIATALAINVVFAAIVLLVAGQAAAAGPDILSSDNPTAAHAIQPGRADPTADGIAGTTSPRDITLATVHRLATRPVLHFYAMSGDI